MPCSELPGSAGHEASQTKIRPLQLRWTFRENTAETFSSNSNYLTPTA